MKRNVFSRAISVILAAIMVMALFVPVAFAADKDYVQDIPRIDMRGFMNATIYEDKNDPTSKVLWPLSSEQIVAEAGMMIPDLIEFYASKSRDWKLLVNPVNEFINNVFADLKCDTSGNPVIATSGAYCKFPTAEELEKSLDVDFCYDWRVDPYESAAQLDKLVRYLADDMGYGEVVLECHSNGGVVMLTYLANYGTNKVRSVCFSASAIYGAGFAGELVKGNLNINADGLAQYVDGALQNNEGSNTIKALVTVFKAAGIMSSLSDFINDIITNLHDEIYIGSIMPIFGNWVNIWSMVPDEDMEAGLDYTFNQLLKDDGNDYSGLKTKINAFTTGIRNNRETHLNNINADCNLYVFSLYGYTGIPITNNWDEMNDGVLLSKDTSMGAQFKKSDSTEYFPKGQYVSPDGKVDGSTAKFKDQTWYFRGCRHSMKADNLTEMSKTLLYYDGQATVSTFAQYPQFMRYDAKTAIAPDDMKPIQDSDGTTTEKKSVFEKIVAFFQMIGEYFALVLGIIKK